MEKIKREIPDDDYDKGGRTIQETQWTGAEMILIKGGGILHGGGLTGGECREDLIARGITPSRGEGGGCGGERE